MVEPSIESKSCRKASITSPYRACMEIQVGVGGSRFTIDKFTLQAEVVAWTGQRVICEMTLAV